MCMYMMHYLEFGQDRLIILYYKTTNFIISTMGEVASPNYVISAEKEEMSEESNNNLTEVTHYQKPSGAVARGCQKASRENSSFSCTGSWDEMQPPRPPMSTQPLNYTLPIRSPPVSNFCLADPPAVYPLFEKSNLLVPRTSKQNKQRIFQDTGAS